jgi:hypothetical protein
VYEALSYRVLESLTCSLHLRSGSLLDSASRGPGTAPPVSIRQHTSAYVSIRQHTSAYVSIRQHTLLDSASRGPGTAPPVSIRQHTSAHVSIRQHTSAYAARFSVARSGHRSTCQHTLAYVSIRQDDLLDSASRGPGTAPPQLKASCTSSLRPHTLVA